MVAGAIVVVGGDDVGMVAVGKVHAESAVGDAMAAIRRNLADDKHLPDLAEAE